MSCLALVRGAPRAETQSGRERDHHERDRRRRGPQPHIAKPSDRRQLERRGQTVAIVRETGVVQLHRLMERQVGQSGRQPGQGSGDGTTHEDGHHVGLARQRRADLAHDIVFLTGRDTLSEDVMPMRADHDQDDGAGREGVIDRVGKVLPGADVLHVHEDAIDAHERAEAVGNAAGVGRRIVAAIVDEDVFRRVGPASKFLIQNASWIPR